MQKVLGNLSKGLFFIVSGPSGSGKNTLMKMLFDEFSCVIESVSFTTRKPRKDEKEGVDYHFITKEEFEKKISNGDFLEHAKVFENNYGTDKNLIYTQLNKGKHIVLIIDTQGALNIKKNNLIEATYIFIAPPSIDELKKRLVNRNENSNDDIQERLSWAEKEIAKQNNYDYVVTNIEIEPSYEVLRSIFIAQEHKNLNKMR